MVRRCNDGRKYGRSPMRKQFWNLVVIVFAAMALGACSKSTTGSNSGTTAPGSSWDSMVWDQGTWT